MIPVNHNAAEKFYGRRREVCFFERRFEERRILKTTPDTLYRESALYVVCDEDGNRDDSAEELFAEFERKAASAPRGIITAVWNVKIPH